MVSGLLNGFVSQGTRAGNDTNAARLVDVTRHDTDFALTGSDHARAVRADQAYAQLVAFYFCVEHIEGRDAFGDAHDQLDASVRSFKDRVFAERCRYVDHAGFCAGFLDRFFHGVENRQAQVRLAAFARRHTTDHLRAIGNRLLGVERALATGETLADDLGVLIDQDAHYLPSAAFTTC